MTSTPPKNEAIEINCKQFVEISTEQVIQENDFGCFINLESDKSTNDDDYFVNIIVPIGDELEDFLPDGPEEVIDIATINDSKNTIEKGKIFLCYFGIESLPTELNSATTCRSFSVAYKMKKPNTTYKYYLLKFKYRLKPGTKTAKAIFVKVDEFIDGKLNPKLKRGTVTTPQSPDVGTSITN